MAKGWIAAGIGAGSRSREAADVQLKKVGFKAFERSFRNLRTGSLQSGLWSARLARKTIAKFPKH